MAKLHYHYFGADIGLPLIHSYGFHNLLHTVDLPSHVHREGVEITYVMKGDACWLLEDGTELFLSGGSLAVVQPNLPHWGEDEVIRPCWLLWFVLNLDLPGCLLNTPFSPSDLACLKKIFSDAGNCVRKAPKQYGFYTERLLAHLPELERSDFLLQSSLRSTLCQIVIASAETFCRMSETGQSGGLVAAATEKIMRNHLGDALSVASIADMLGLDETGFHRQFKKETGLTPADFFRRIKIAESRRRLADSDASITSIAFGLGFSSSQHFASVFKKYTGLTPRDFRRKIQTT